MFHVSSLMPIFSCMYAGASMISMAHFDPGLALDLLEREQATFAIPAFPTITNQIVNYPGFANRSLDQLRTIINVAPPELLKQYQGHFPQAVQIGVWGMTEACGGVCINEQSESLEQRLFSCGRPLETVQLRITNPDTLEEVSPDEVGEAWLRGDTVFGGYYGDADKNRASFHDGWFRSGDLCALDEDGRLRFHGRLKDMIKVGGENVAALEIEAYLSSHPAVNIVQVIAVPDDHYGEVAAACIELRAGAEASEEAIVDFCRGKIASYKVPRHVRFVHEWPMSATKIQKFKLRELFEQETTND